MINLLAVLEEIFSQLVRANVAVIVQQAIDIYQISFNVRDLTQQPDTQWINAIHTETKSVGGLPVPDTGLIGKCTKETVGQSHYLIGNLGPAPVIGDHCGVSSKQCSSGLASVTAGEKIVNQALNDLARPACPNFVQRVMSSVTLLLHVLSHAFHECIFLINTASFLENLSLIYIFETDCHCHTYCLKFTTVLLYSECQIVTSCLIWSKL
jgi:hypothetical protein